MHDCIVKLLKNHDEESLECLCRLLSTIGKDLDFEKAKVHHIKDHIVKRRNGASVILPLSHSIKIYCFAIFCLSSASYGPIFQSDGKNHKREENHLQNTLYVAGCAGPEMGKYQYTILYVCYAV